MLWVIKFTRDKKKHQYDASAPDLCFFLYIILDYDFAKLKADIITSSYLNIN